MGMHDGRVAFVTGAASGIGRASAELFAREGARVAAADLDAVGVEETAHAIERAGGEAIALTLDVAEEEDVDRAIATIVDRFGRLDAAHNNAGISSPGFVFHEMSKDEWDRMIRVNLTSVFLCIKAELAQMVGQDVLGFGRGAICNTSSGAAVVPAPLSDERLDPSRDRESADQLMAEHEITDEQLQKAAYRFPTNTPASKENYLYRQIFESHFPGDAAAATVPHGMSIACSTPTAIRWDKMFEGRADPSGRAVEGVHNDAY